MSLSVVVGANGFIGNKLVDELLKRGEKVIAVYNNNIDKINELADLLTIEELFASNLEPDFIYFLVGNYMDNQSKLLFINDILYKLTKKFKDSKFIYASSTNVYGQHDGIIYEDSYFNKPSIYAISKLAGEFIVSNMSKHANVRLSYLYGPGINNNSFIPYIIKNAKENGKITLFGSGVRQQDYLHVDDAVDLLIKSAISTTNMTFLGASGSSTSNIEVANQIAKYIPCKIEFKGEEMSYSVIFNPFKTQKILNWKSKISFPEGIKGMLR